MSGWIDKLPGFLNIRNGRYAGWRVFQYLYTVCRYREWCQVVKLMHGKFDSTVISSRDSEVFHSGKNLTHPLIHLSNEIVYHESRCPIFYTNPWFGYMDSYLTKILLPVLSSFGETCLQTVNISKTLHSRSWSTAQYHIFTRQGQHFIVFSPSQQHKEWLCNICN